LADCCYYLLLAGPLYQFALGLFSFCYIAGDHKRVLAIVEIK
jgi:hypothetical protein